jgi:serine/threonine-protein kinase ATR
LARKGNQIEVAQDFTVRAAALGAPTAKLEQCRLLWKGGYPQKAIQMLKGTLEDKSFEFISHSVKSYSTVSQGPENLLLAKTKLLLVKWMDHSGTQKATAIRAQYADVARMCSRSDKGHYYLGSFYNKLLDSEKNKPEEEQTSSVQSGDTAKLVIDNYLRSMMYGPKYLYRTVPKVLTLWLDFGHDLVSRRKKQKSASRRKQDELDQLVLLREKTLKGMHTQIKKYMLDRLQPYVVYTGFAQMLSRIDHSEPEVAQLLHKVIARIACRHPRQTLWSLLSVTRSGSQDKKQVAINVLTAIKVSVSAIMRSQLTKFRTPKAAPMI